MIIVLIVLICIFLIAGFITGNFLFNLALNPKTSKSIIFNPEIDEIKAQMKIENEKWLKENANDVYIQNKKINYYTRTKRSCKRVQKYGSC